MGYVSERSARRQRPFRVEWRCGKMGRAKTFRSLKDADRFRRRLPFGARSSIRFIEVPR